MGVASDGSGGTSSAVSLLSETIKQTSKKGWFNKRPEKEKSGEGRTLIQKVLKDILTAADHLHRHVGLRLHDACVARTLAELQSLQWLT